MTEIRLDVEADEPGDEPGRSRRPAHRSRWGAAYLVAVVVLVSAVAYFIDVVGGDPDDVVADYLAAIRDGDPDAALAIAGVTREDDPRDVFQRAEALRSDWRVTSVTTRRQAERKAVVDVTITGPDGPRAGVFRLERRDGSGWRIGNPFVPLYLVPPPLWVDGDQERNRLTLNGMSVTRPRTPDGSSGDGGIQLRLFPGTYTFFADEPLVKPVETARTWLPPGDGTSLVPHTPRLALTGKGFRLADTAVRDVLATCAGASEAMPEGCPFGTGAEVTAADGTEYRLDGGTVSWRVPELPELYFADTGFGLFWPVGREPFTVELRFTDDGGKNRTVDCGVDMETLAFGLSTKAEVVFTNLGDTPQTCL